MNRELAEKLVEDSKGKVNMPSFTGVYLVLLSFTDLSQADVSNPLGDERFVAMFTNPDFQVDEESEVCLTIMM